MSLKGRGRGGSGKNELKQENELPAHLFTPHNKLTGQYERKEERQIKQGKTREG